MSRVTSLDWVRLFRPRFNYLIAIFCAIALAKHFSLFDFLLVSAFSYSALFYGTFVNFFHDFNIDIKNPSMKKYIHISGKISRRKIRTLMNLFLGLTILFGALLVISKKNLIFAPLTLWAILCGLSYSAPPLRLKRFWWGGMITYTLSTSGVFLTSAFVFGLTKPILMVLTMLVFWCGSLSGFMLAHISDKDFDKSSGLETPPIKFGKERCIWFYVIFVFLSCVFGTITSILFFKPEFIFLFLLSLLFSIFVSKSIRNEKILEKVRSKAYRLGVIPYRINMISLLLMFIIG